MLLCLGRDCSRQGEERGMYAEVRWTKRGTLSNLSSFSPSLTLPSLPQHFWELVLLILLCPARSEGLI